MADTNSKNEMTIFHMGEGMFQYFLLFQPPRKINIHTPSIALKWHRRQKPGNAGKFQNTLSSIEENPNTKPKKQVKFVNKPDIRSTRVWQFAHRQARKDIWQQMGRDRVRFRRRINDLSVIISPNLLKKMNKITENLKLQ